MYPGCSPVPAASSRMYEQVNVMAVSNVVFAIAMMLVLLRITQYVSLISTRLFVMRRSASNAFRMLKCAGASPSRNPSPDPDALVMFQCSFAAAPRAHIPTSALSLASHPRPRLNHYLSPHLLPAPFPKRGAGTSPC